MKTIRHIVTAAGCLMAIILPAFPVGAIAAPTVAGISSTAAVADTIAPQRTSHMADRDTLHADTLHADSAALASMPVKTKKTPKELLPKPAFRPDPKRALWLSLVIPGAGQIYNRKYWKLPIIYGGFLGCTYAFMWNQQMYRDYSQAYLDIMDDNPDTNSYLEMLPPRYDITGREEQFKRIFKNKKNYYRRYRDLSAFCFIGVYLLSVVDAYVDAQLSEFDISPDLSLRLQPAVISNPDSPYKNGGYGVGCSLNF